MDIYWIYIGYIYCDILYFSILSSPTWATQFYEYIFYDYIFQIPIDHILHKGDLKLVDKHRGSAMGSDHYPLIAIFVLQ